MGGGRERGARIAVSDAETIKNLLKSRTLLENERDVLARVAKRLELEEAELSRSARAEDDTRPIGPGAKAR